MAGNVSQLREGAETGGDGKLPSGEVLKKLANRQSKLKADMDEARGEIGAMIKDAEETHNVHRKAFKLATQIEKMDGDKRSAFLAHFDHYRKVFELDAQGNLFDGEAA